MIASLCGRVSSLQVGRIGAIGAARKRSAFNKAAVSGPVAVGPLGLAGDQQANRRYHGGPDKAVYCYPGEHYTVWRALYPALAEQFVPGSLGDNVTLSGIAESDVCIDDIFSFGTALLQAVMPRTPCRTITERFGDPSIGAVMHERGLRGFYARVLRTGLVQANDDFVLTGRTRAERIADLKPRPPARQGFAGADRGAVTALRF